MLRSTARWAGRRAAAFAALAYLACLLMPSVALAVAPGAVSAYCFDEIVDEIAALKARNAPGQVETVHLHVHADGTVHYHDHGGSPADASHQARSADQGADAGKAHSHSHPPGTHDATCCGVFGFTAVLPRLDGAITTVPAAYHIQPPVVTESLVGRGAGRIDRPPIVSLPI